MCAHGKRIKRIRSERDRTSDAARKSVWASTCDENRRNIEQNCQRFHRSAALFLAETFDFVTLSDLCTDGLLKQPRISTFVKRRMGVLAIEEYWSLVCAACDVLTEHVKTFPSKTRLAPRRRSSAENCVLPICRAAKTVFCPFGS